MRIIKYANSGTVTWFSGGCWLNVKFAYIYHPQLSSFSSNKIDARVYLFIYELNHVLSLLRPHPPLPLPPPSSPRLLYPLKLLNEKFAILRLRLFSKICISYWFWYRFCINKLLFANFFFAIFKQNLYLQVGWGERGEKSRQNFSPPPPKSWN